MTGVQTCALPICAGTITCNYDGVNKWPTLIEDGAFIGSGTMLVAPVRIGSGATIGAGTITCNYDGVNKWPTLIEDGAFIGSGAMLIAPVRIGSGATIGAGSTITKTAPAGTLTLERAKQTSINEWQRPQEFNAEEKKARVDKALKKSEN